MWRETGKRPLRENGREIAREAAARGVQVAGSELVGHPSQAPLQLQRQSAADRRLRRVAGCSSSGCSASEADHAPELDSPRGSEQRDGSSPVTISLSRGPER